jgi:two-component system response regulator PilR (NtrC family)
MKLSTALIVDDEPDIRELLALTLKKMSIQVMTAATVGEAREQLNQNDFNLCITDMRLPDGSGLELLETIQQDHPHIPVAVLTAHGNMDLAIQSLKAGAFDFVSKPVDLTILRQLVNTALKLSCSSSQKDRRSRKTLLGKSSAMQNTRAAIAKLARSQAPVYISGESGTGKELVARLIHEKGGRASQPFVAVNCGAIPGELMESEFFGHKKGSFTGATSDKEGLFHAANGGTLFLDEVAELPLHMQVKLLRVIQEKSIRPVGSQKEETIDVRILSATHKDLEQLVETGDFRQDLFYRINVINLKVPPLRHRREDLPELIEHFLIKQSEASNEACPTLSSDAEKALMHYDFPGNIRELENILERATTWCEKGVIQREDLQLKGLPDAYPDSDSHTDTSLLQRQPDESLEEFLESIEKEAIEAALKKTDYNKTAAAREMGISFRALRYRLKKLNMD